MLSILHAKYFSYLSLTLHSCLFSFCSASGFYDGLPATVAPLWILQPFSLHPTGCSHHLGDTKHAQWICCFTIKHPSVISCHLQQWLHIVLWAVGSTQVPPWSSVSMSWMMSQWSSHPASLHLNCTKIAPLEFLITSMGIYLLVLCLSS